MASVNHNFVSAKLEQSDATLVGPVEWNAGHVAVGAVNAVISTDGSGNLTFTNVFTYSSGALALGGTATASIIGGTAANTAFTIESTSGAGTSDLIKFLTGSQSERLRIDNSGNILVAGSASAGTALTGNTGPSWLTIIADGTVSNAINIQEINANGAAATINISKTRGAVNAHTALNSTDNVGFISYWGDDGTQLRNTATIEVNVDGAVSGGNMPMRMQFFTGATTSASERLRIDSAGHLTIGGAANQSVASSASILQVNDTSNAAWDLSTISWNGSVAGWLQASSRGGSIGTHALSNSGDIVLYLEGYGDNGTGFSGAGRMQLVLDGTPSATSMPGRIMFFTTTSGTLVESERLRIDSGGALVTGGVAQQTSIFSNLPQVNFNAGGTLVIQSEMSWTASTNGSVLHLCHSRSNTIGTHVALNNNDDIGGVFYGASDGTAFQPAASVNAQSDGAAAGGSTPGRLLFQTTPSGSTTLSERMRIDSNGNVQVKSGTLGYGTGVGGTITQATNRTTAVTLNKICGQITLVSAAGSATPATFTVNNTTIAATDTVIVNQASGADKYEIFVTNIAGGTSFAITSFTTGGTTTEQPVFNFAILKAVTS